MKFAFIFAHPDDESLSSGGTIAKYSSQGHEVATVCLSSSPIRKAEYFNATEILGVNNQIIYDFNKVENNETEIKEKLIEFILSFRPQIVVTHLENDYHIDHRLTNFLVKEAIEWAAHETQYKNAYRINKLYTTETTILIPNPMLIVDITNTYQIKEKAIKCYKSQLYKGGQDFYIRFHKYRTKMRGAQGSVEFAEAFQEIPIKKTSPFYKQKSIELY